MKRLNFKLFFVGFLLVAIGILAGRFIESWPILLGLGLTVALLTSLSLRDKKSKLSLLSGIESIDFRPENLNFSEEDMEVISGINRSIKNNLKTQIEISTDVVEKCEELNLMSDLGLASTANIYASVELVEGSASSQVSMLNKTLEVSKDLSRSNSEIEKEIDERIKFISSSIALTQKEIQTVSNFESRVLNTRSMTEKTMKKISDLEDYSNKVGRLIELIGNISSETKMLSLNASIEAARAGEEGRGFSIVAQEVGNLALETEKVSKEIEEVLNILRNEIKLIAKDISSDLNYSEENHRIIQKTNKELQEILNSLSLGNENLDEIKEITLRSSKFYEELNTNINSLSEFSKDVLDQVHKTRSDSKDQRKLSEDLNLRANEIKAKVQDLQEFVAGKAMEEMMLVKAKKLKEEFGKLKKAKKQDIDQLAKQLGVDSIYITDPEGSVEYTNESNAIGLNLYQADPSFSSFKSKDIHFIVTPIKKRVEDGKLFKFLTIKGEEGRLYEIGLSLDRLMA